MCGLKHDIAETVICLIDGCFGGILRDIAGTVICLIDCYFGGMLLFFFLYSFYLFFAITRGFMLCSI